MAVKIRLARHGAKKAPFYRVVVADGRARRDGRFIEIVGRYNPRTTPTLVELDVEKIEAWVAKGAQPTEAVQKLLVIAKSAKTEIAEADAAEAAVAESVEVAVEEAADTQPAE
ncbi:MAG: 30S ribosomal protein S16 [Coriobacteriia bacterium]|nr:30S ribosomal protein S16 [Coriobacteriia bacterium]